MTTVAEAVPPAKLPDISPIPGDHRASPIPTFAMIASRFKELRKRRGLMITLALVDIGIPTIFVVIRLILHAASPHKYGPAGGYSLYTAMASVVLYTLGFIVAAALGCTAGSIDLTEGMFRHLVVTGRSRLALYLARIPAGLAVIVPVVAVGFAIVCAVCVFAAPASISYQGVTVPAGLSVGGLESWAAGHADEVVCQIGPGPSINPNSSTGQVINADACGGGPNNGPTGSVKIVGPGGPVTGVPVQPTQAQIVAAARQIARSDYSDYSSIFRVPSNSLMIRTGLWIELEAAIGLIVGIGLGSLTGQRTTSVIIMIVLQVVLTPTIAATRIPGFSNLQRAVVGLATDHLAPGGIPVIGGGGGGPGGGHGNAGLLPESTRVAVCVIVAWLVGWTVIGAWRMIKRDS